MGDHIGVVLLAAKIAVGYPLIWADPAHYIIGCQISEAQSFHKQNI